MPRIEVVTSINNQWHHRRIQAGIVGVFTDEGLSPVHVSTEFYPMQHTLIYAGRESLDEVLGKRDFALVRTYISTRRSQEFRDKFVGAVVRVFDGLGVDQSNVAIDFVLREPEDAYIGTVRVGATRISRFSVSSADTQSIVEEVSAQTRSTTDSTSDSAANMIEESVRELLAQFWGTHLRSAPSDSTLLALVPNATAWNSLAKAEIATNLETWLELPFNTLDIGTERVNQMFADTVTLGILVNTLAELTGSAT